MSLSLHTIWDWESSLCSVNCRKPVFWDLNSDLLIPILSLLLTGDVGTLHIIEMSAPTFMSQDQISASFKHCPWSLKLNRCLQVPSISPKGLLAVFILDGGINNTLIFSVNNWSKFILTSEPCLLPLKKKKSHPTRWLLENNSTPVAALIATLEVPAVNWMEPLWIYFLEITIFITSALRCTVLRFLEENIFTNLFLFSIFIP